MIRFALYCFCGGIGVLSDLSLYYVLLAFGVPYQAANAAGYMMGTLISFILNRRITFGVRDQLLRRLAMFFGVAGVGYLASALMLWVMIDRFHIDAALAKILTLPVVVIIQFSLNRLLTFRQNRTGVDASESI
ncbi:Putative flippase GtrA (transmembrane translocase of bactoprenol-linked glucose) [Halopseudomonas xinjiangensis]|uniref:Putative flippase GtrA (Transmembrane translocase of bactoprenol-linked glucose) n=1 Tax=Halopseudomonas xinjiangensis TaxID=487184 RepID=A0A1H1NPM9_9GAMM|nr:GtrA family protein [Halopseudomonas xinjiangensis]SDS00971.1 Putative flippase GtrA (transmembrane translocase of bactoprenol-linked glucose) [Halopseudomonas xinjiangensis]